MDKDYATEKWVREMECLDAMKSWNPMIELSGCATRFLLIPAVIFLCIAAAVRNPSGYTVGCAIISPALGIMAQWTIWFPAIWIMTRIKHLPFHKASVHIVYTIAYIIWPIAGSAGILTLIHTALECLAQ